MRWGLLTVFTSCLWGLLQCDTGGHDSRQRLIKWRGPLTPRATGRPPNLGPTRRPPDQDGPRPGRAGKIRKATSSAQPATASRTCAVDGLLLYQGAVWSPQPCTLCACEEGRAVCQDIECLPASCRRPRTPPGRCCPVCLPDAIPGGTIAPGSEVVLTGSVPARRKEGRREPKGRRIGKHGKAAKVSGPGSGRPRASPAQPGERTPEKGTGKRELDAEKQAPREKPRPGRQAPGAAARTRGSLPKVQEVSLRKQGAVIQAGLKRPDVGLKKPGSGFKKPEEGLKILESGLKRAEVGLKRLEDGLKKLEEGLEKPEVGLKPQKIGLKNKPEVVVQAGFKKPKLGLKKQDISLKDKTEVVVEAGLKKPKLGLKKQDISLKNKPEVVIDAGLNKLELGLKKQDIGLTIKPDVGFKKPEVSLQTLGGVAIGGPRQPGAVPEKPEAAGKVVKGAAPKRRQEGGPATGAPRQKVLPGRQKAGSATEGRKREAWSKGQGVASGGARARGPAPTKPHGGSKGREAGRAESARAGKQPSRSSGAGKEGALPPRLAGREEENAAAATSVPVPKELLPPAESEFNMPSLPVGCILAENAIACPAAKLIDIPTLVDSDLHTLYLADNGIKTVSAVDFAGLLNLQWLDLSRNKISDNGLDRDAFQNVSRLRRLNLDGNRILRVPWLPPSLNELKLNDNLLEGLERNSLRGLHRLLTLDLEGNGLNDGNVNPNAFRPLKKLIYLRLGRNRFRAMPSGLPPSLRELHLENNHIEEIPGGLLNKTLNLTIVVLRHNRLQEDRIAPRAWIHLRNLETLDLSHNRLVHVPSFLPTGLKQLLLHHNLIERIPGYVFAHLKPGLEFLHLSYNQLRDDGIHGISFLGLYKSLHELLLDHNQLRAVPRGILNLRVLQVLRLSDNQIRYVPLDSICDTRISEDSNLVSIHLENNLIDRKLIPPTAFSCIQAYQSIILRPQRFED